MSWVAAAIGGSAVVGGLTSYFGSQTHGDPNNTNAKEAAWKGVDLPNYSGGQVYAPPDGSSPLTALPTGASGPGGGSQAASYYAAQDFYKIFGRNPSATELAQITPAYVSGDPNILNNTAGQSAISQYYQSIANSPANIASRQQKQWASQAPQNYGTVQQITQSLLGRAPTQNELDHYGTLIASGQADPYQIQQFIQATPEYQNAQDTTFRKGVDTQLQQSDSQFFDTQKGNIAQTYAQMGRATSPALDVALTQLASQLNSNRQSYLAQLSASQYGGNKDAATAQYQNTENQVQGQINQNTQGIYQNQQQFQQRQNQLADYQRQQTDFNNAYARYGNKPPGALDYLNTALNTAKTGAQVYGAYAGSPSNPQNGMLPVNQV